MFVFANGLAPSTSEARVQLQKSARDRGEMSFSSNVYSLSSAVQLHLSDTYMQQWLAC